MIKRKYVLLSVANQITWPGTTFQHVVEDCAELYNMIEHAPGVGDEASILRQLTLND